MCKQTVETLIRRRVLWRLIWVCTVGICPTKRTIDLHCIWVQQIQSTDQRFIPMPVDVRLFEQPQTEQYVLSEDHRLTLGTISDTCQPLTRLENHNLVPDACYIIR